MRTQLQIIVDIDDINTIDNETYFMFAVHKSVNDVDSCDKNLSQSQKYKISFDIHILPNSTNVRWLVFTSSNSVERALFHPNPFLCERLLRTLYSNIVYSAVSRWLIQDGSWCKTL